ncbi:hypothetical protein RLM19_00750, partial [Streptococcus pneumoniae]|nr:hypothetical protein [Streptococcus pneumoniae]
ARDFPCNDFAKNAIAHKLILSVMGGRSFFSLPYSVSESFYISACPDRVHKASYFPKEFATQF